MTHTSSPSWFILRSKATADIRYNALIPTVLLASLADQIGRLLGNNCCGFTATVGGEVSIDVAGLIGNEPYPTLLPTMLKLVLAQSVLYHLVSNLVKVSLIIQYMRLFSPVLHVVWSCYVLLVLIVGATGWGVFGNVFLCKPVQSYWNITIKGTRMNNEKHFWSASVTTLLRLILMQHTVHRGEATKCGTYTIIFSSIEVNIAIVCASLIVMKPLLARFLPYVISEQPLSAAEDRRACRALTGVHLMRASMAEAAKNRERAGRNDTVIEMNEYSR